MASESLPADVASLLRQELLSVDEIEVLTVLAEAPSRWWDEKLMGMEISGMTTAGARRILDRLAAVNLLDIRVTDAVRYRFQPGTEELAATVYRLLSMYRSERETVVRAARRVSRRDV